MSNAKLKIERQVKLPTSKAVEIAWKSIRLRLSRSLVVTSGIVLAMAFLMFILCSDSTVDAMRRWSQIAPQTDEYKVAEAKAREIQPKVQGYADDLVKASVANKKTGSFDDKKTFGKELSQIQRELGALPVAPDDMKTLLGARPEMVPVMQGWMQSTQQLREAKAILNGPQNLTAIMKGNGVPTSEKDIINSKMQTRWLIGLALLVAFAGTFTSKMFSRAASNSFSASGARPARTASTARSWCASAAWRSPRRACGSTPWAPRRRGGRTSSSPSPIRRTWRAATR